MSSEPDKFTEIMESLGFTSTDSGEITETVTRLVVMTIPYETDEGFPVSLELTFPEGQAMEAARAIVTSGTSKGIRALLATAYENGDASVAGYFDANGIDGDRYNEAITAEIQEEGVPKLSDADEFFDLT